jgi:hypothetical protein
MMMMTMTMMTTMTMRRRMMMMMTMTMMTTTMMRFAMLVVCGGEKVRAAVTSQVTSGQFEFRCELVVAVVLR